MGLSFFLSFASHLSRGSFHFTMAIGKNKRLSKGKKGSKKKIIDPFTRKEWYDFKAPNLFNERQVGKTLVNRTAGTKIASDGLKGRVVEVCLADLQKDENEAYRLMQLRVEDVQGPDCLTNFHGMNFTTDKLRSLVRKWQTLIEANVEITTTDNFRLRIFLIGFTKRMPNQQKKTCYAQSSQVRQIRKKMVSIIQREAANCSLKDMVVKFIPNGIGKQIEKECQGIYPLKDVFIRKVKVVKGPKFDSTRLMDLHVAREDTGAKVAAAATPA